MKLTSCKISIKSSPVKDPSRMTSKLCKCSTAASYWLSSGPGRMCAFTPDLSLVVRLNCAWMAKLVKGSFAAGKDNPVKASNTDVFPLDLSPMMATYGESLSYHIIMTAGFYMQSAPYIPLVNMWYPSTPAHATYRKVHEGPNPLNSLHL